MSSKLWNKQHGMSPIQSPLWQSSKQMKEQNLSIARVNLLNAIISSQYSLESNQNYSQGCRTLAEDLYHKK